MNKTDKKIKQQLVTSALPYANGSIHLGHLVEYIQTDIWVRFQKLMGNQTYYFCADDTHGTPVMIAAKNQNISPEEMIKKMQEEHYHDLSSFQIEFTNYYSTNSPENQNLSDEIFLKLKEAGHIYQREIEQAFCQKDNIFLPDRFIKGTCPSCGSQDQYGDSCDSCGTTYSPLELIDPHCAICHQAPTQKKSIHYFFKLKDFAPQLEKWYSDGTHVSAGVAKKMSEWFKGGLNDWDISRDGPYFGFKIPGEENKYYYVWLDAPVGYMASSKNFFTKQGKPELFDMFWREDNDFEIYHFIGKDIMYFHTLFWPAELMGAGFQTPRSVFIHGFLTINGEKMSKSKGTFILARDYLKHLDTSYLRFYYAAKLSDAMDDIDLNFQDFTFKINSDLVGNFINIFSRLIGNIAKKIDYKLGSMDDQGQALFKEILDKKDKIFTLYEERKFSQATREIMQVGDRINKYINDHEPWTLVKNDKEKATTVITVSLNAARLMAAYLKPILPEITLKIEKLLNIEPITFSNLDFTMENHRINPYEHLIERVDEKKIEQMMEESKESLTKNKKVSGPESAEISMEDFSKIDLRVGVIKEAFDVEGADKLLNLKIDLGPLGVRNVFAGIKKAYTPDQLIGKKCLVLVNLKARKMKFGISEAMVLATGEGEQISLLVPDTEAKVGDRVK
jgi:methionyl-tRNA synthetase